MVVEALSSQLRDDGGELTEGDVCVLFLELLKEGIDPAEQPVVLPYCELKKIAEESVTPGGATRELKVRQLV